MQIDVSDGICHDNKRELQDRAVSEVRYPMTLFVFIASRASSNKLCHHSGGDGAKQRSALTLKLGDDS